MKFLNQRKGITPAITIVILLLIAVAVVGLAYAFITGFFTTVTGTAGYVGGSSTCDGATGDVTIIVTNGGTGSIDPSDVIVTRQGCTPAASPACSTGQVTQTLSASIAPQGVGSITGIPCGTPPASGTATVTCTYGVTIGGVTYPTSATCNM